MIPIALAFRGVPNTTHHTTTPAWAWAGYAPAALVRARMTPPYTRGLFLSRGQAHPGTGMRRACAWRPAGRPFAQRHGRRCASRMRSRASADRDGAVHIPLAHISLDPSPRCTDSRRGVLAQIKHLGGGISPIYSYGKDSRFRAAVVQYQLVTGVASVLSTSTCVTGTCALRVKIHAVIEQNWCYTLQEDEALYIYVT